MTDPVTSGMVGWVVSKIMDRIASLRKQQTTTEARLNELKAKVHDLVEENERLRKKLNTETAKRLKLQADLKITKARNKKK